MQRNSADGTECLISDSIRLEIRMREVHVSFFGGCDWMLTQAERQCPQQARGQRDVDRLVKIVVLHTRCHASYRPCLTLGGVCMGDFFISESVSSDDRVVKPVLSHWRSDTLHPRGTEEGLLQLRASIDGPIIAIKVKVLPLRCCLDAKLIGFSRTFSHSVATRIGRVDSKFPAKRDPKIVVIEVAALAFKLDYKPRGIDAKQLYSGALDELSQVFSLERVEVKTRRCRVVARTVSLALDHLWHLWCSELSEEQIHKFIFGASLVRPIHAVGTSIAGVLSCPLEASSLKNTWHLLRREFATCGRVLVYESTSASRRLITQLAVATDAVADRLDGQSDRGRAFKTHGYHLESGRGAVSQGLDEAHGACVAVIAHRSTCNVVRDAPIAILRSAAGLSRGIAILLLGVEESAAAQA